MFFSRTCAVLFTIFSITAIAQTNDEATFGCRLQDESKRGLYTHLLYKDRGFLAHIQVVNVTTSGKESVSMGSGFVIRDEDGRLGIITSNHVVADDKESKFSLEVIFDGSAQSYPIKIIGTDPVIDVALLEMPEKPPAHIRPIRVGKSEPPYFDAGCLVYMVGYPMDLGKNITSGYVSSFPQYPAPIYVRIDGALHPGCSGGPLVRLGRDNVPEVVGINFAIITNKVTNNTVGGTFMALAIPYYLVERVYPLLRQGKTVAHSSAGFHLVDTKDGVVVASIDKDSSAFRGGIRTEDSIKGLSYKGKTVLFTNARELQELIFFDIPPQDMTGAEIILDVARNGKMIQHAFTLDRLSSPQ